MSGNVAARPGRDGAPRTRFPCIYCGYYVIPPFPRGAIINSGGFLEFDYCCNELVLVCFCGPTFPVHFRIRQQLLFNSDESTHFRTLVD